MSDAKVRARRRRRGNRAWTAAMSPVELALTPGKPSPSLCEYVEHTCNIPASLTGYSLPGVWIVPTLVPAEVLNDSAAWIAKYG
jgi:hypothetical protein